MERFFRAELPTVTVACWDGSVEVPRLGRTARLSLFDNTTYRGPTADLLLDGDGEARVHRVIESLRSDPEAARAALERPLAETFGLREALPSDALFLPTPEDEQRRRRALDEMFARFPAVAARVRDIWGLRLPRHIAVYAAFVRSLSPLEKLGQDHVGRSPWGILLYFEDGSLERTTRDGLDPRLEGRFRCDPPEFVTVMGGDTDGLHYGLWYDDPAALPVGIAHNYARDSAETSLGEPTVIAELTAYLRDHFEEHEDPGEPHPLSAHAFRAALRWFEEEDSRAFNEDAPHLAPDAPRGPIVGGLGPLVDPSQGNARATYAELEKRYEAYQAGKAEPIIRRARAELEAGRPAFALTVGRELHWLDADETREASLELLVGAYRALGRDALAEIARVHHANRDLQSVGVFE